MGAEFDRAALVSIFVAEATDGITKLWTALHPADASIPGPEAIQPHYVVAHTIKGTAAMYGFAGVASLADTLEPVLEQATRVSGTEWPGLVAMLRDAVGILREQIEAIGRLGSEDQPAIEAWKTRYSHMKPASQDSPADSSPDEFLSASYLNPDLDPEVISYFAPEAQEYVEAIETALLRLEKNPQDPDTIQQLFRTAHTLKGSAYTVGFKAIGDLTHHVEDYMGAIRDGRMQMMPALIDVIFRFIDVIRQLMRRDARALDKTRREFSAVMQGLRGITMSAAVQVHPASAPVTPPTESLEDSYLYPELDPDVFSYFAPEAQEYVEAIEAALLRLEKNPQDPDTIQQLFRTAHTLKGSAYTVGFKAIGDLTHHVEDYMGAIRDGRMQMMLGVTDLFFRAVDVVRQLMRRDRSNLAKTRREFSAVMHGLKEMSGALPSAVSAPPEQKAAVAPSWFEPADRQRVEPPQAPTFQKPEEEAGKRQETDRQQGAEPKPTEEGAVIRVSRERLERLLNLVGELVIGRGRLEQRLLVLEQLSHQVQVYRNRLQDSVRTFEEKHAFTLPSSSPSMGEASGPGFAGLTDFGSLEFDKYDDFNVFARRTAEVSTDINEAMSQLSNSIKRAREDMDQVQRLTLGMRDEIARARMVPIGTPFTRFRRAVREMARTTGKDVTLITSGEQTEVDTGVVERLVDPLIHLVRNAVYHGIEPSALRIAQGKPPVGSVYIHAAHRGNAVVIEVEDDGRGLDLEKIKAKAVQLGLLRQAAASALSDTEAAKLIFLPGVSTAEQVGDQAGRGMGMDVVKRAIEGMNGQIDIESARGVGTKFALTLPVSLLISMALMVRAGNERYAFPLPSTREVVLPPPGALQDMGGRSVLQIGEEAIEVRSLAQLLGIETSMPSGPTPVVIVRALSGAVGLAVDELLGRQEIVIKSLGSLRPFQKSFFAGATIDPEGRVVLVIDVGRLLAGRLGQEALATEHASLPATEPGSPTDEGGLQIPDKTARILLIDDSLSVRKFVGRMLEGGGYAVDTAVDGEDGLRKASAVSYRLIITDLEMPKVNGYEVIQALRSRPQTQATPILVMTTRAADKHRQMAMSLGATAYIAKPVNERTLIQDIERWIGQGTSVGP
ncbi:MAG: Hpt domain-containing protein [Nitrospiraceae bacterium]